MDRSISHVVLVAAIAMACGSDSSAPTQTALVDGSGDVQAARVTGGVRVTNNTNQSVPYVVWDRGFLGLLGLGPCDESEPYCTKLRSGESVTVREGVDGFAGFGDAAVYWYGTKGDSTGIHVVIVGGGKPYPNQPIPPDTSSR
jgi:hypothetical protein